jgi:RNA polymerase sigma-70 factor (ECF subfamily)
VDDLDALAVAWQRGDRAAFRELVLRLQTPLRIYVSSFSVSTEQVEEILQETFVTCFEKIAQYQPRGAFAAWLKTIARNHLMDHWRERRRLAELDQDVALTLIAGAELDDLETPEPAAARSARLARCLEKLPQRSRTLIERRHLHERPLAELARQFKQSMAALSVALHRIRQALRKCIDQEPAS